MKNLEQNTHVERQQYRHQENVHWHSSGVLIVDFEIFGTSFSRLVVSLEHVFWWVYVLTLEGPMSIHGIYMMGTLVVNELR